MNHDEMIAVIQAHKDGRTVEWRSKTAKAGEPFEWTPAAAFDFIYFAYRIKPEPPKPREWWALFNEDWEVCTGCGLSNSLEAASERNHRSHFGQMRIIQVREVLEK